MKIFQCIKTCDELIDSTQNLITLIALLRQSLKQLNVSIIEDKGQYLKVISSKSITIDINIQLIHTTINVEFSIKLQHKDSKLKFDKQFYSLTLSQTEVYKDNIQQELNHHIKEIIKEIHRISK